MSVDGETSRVMKGVQHGACDYLLKPIRMKELRNIWQHVLRKKINEGRDIDSQEVIDGLQMARSGLAWSDDHFFCGEDISSGKKRKEAESRHNEKDLADPGSSTKKARVVWSIDLHQKFVKAVNQIGFESEYRIIFLRSDFTCLISSELVLQITNYAISSDRGIMHLMYFGRSWS